MKLVFMGTPDFAVPTLEALLRGGHEVQAVVTQPDKPKGRGKSVLMTPVKEKAVEAGIPVYQPVRIRDDAEFLEVLKKLAPDAIVVTAFGQILPEEILNLPKYGCFNVHASLLPRYRGAAPIQWAVINGDKESGVTIMQMELGLDTGDMLDTYVYELDKKETGGSLFDKLAEEGGNLILATLEKAEKGQLTPVKQPEEGACYASMLTKTMGEIDWNRSATEIERLIRGLNPWPSAYSHYEGKTLKIWDADVLIETEQTAAPGTVLRSGKDALVIACGSDALSIRELQLEGKKRMETAAFLRGYSIEEGSVLGKKER